MSNSQENMEQHEVYHKYGTKNSNNNSKVSLK